MAFTPRFKEKLVTLTSLHDNLVPVIAEMPHLARDHTALASLVTQARELESRQDLATAELRSINRQRVELARQGRTLRNRLAQMLRGTLGVDHADLAKYGVQPLVRGPRPKRLSKFERAQQLALQAQQAKAELDAEASAAAKAAAEAQRRASSVGQP
jgi:hypothetical protein